MREVCWPAGLKKTRQRQRIWEILAQAQGPLDAGEIHRLVQDEGFAISTVYRALAAFEEYGAVTTTRLPDRDLTLYSLRRGEHQHYAICLSCRRQIPLEKCPVTAEVVADDFQVTGHRLELYGYCRGCREGKKHGKA